MACEIGIRLLKDRDDAIAAINDEMSGKILGDSDDPDHKAKMAEYLRTVGAVENPAYIYNEHVKACHVCQANPPVGPYTKKEGLRTI
jgi:hypothetical protein